MYNVLLILLHRPFVAEGHLYTDEPTIAISSFSICSKGAKQIVRLLRSYDRAFSVRRAPYLISYATYVAATIHVRIAAQSGAGSDAHIALQHCLNVFDENMETNSAVRRAKVVIVNLMKRMGVTLDRERDALDHNSVLVASQQQDSIVPGPITAQSTSPTVIADQPHNPTTPELDIGMIIQSFIHDQSNNVLRDVMYNGLTPAGGLHSELAASGASETQDHPVPPTWDYSAYANGYTIDDLLFGFNGSAQDGAWMERYDNSNTKADLGSGEC